MASSGIPAADGFVKHLQDIQSGLALLLSIVKEAQARYYNQDRRVSVLYQPGDLVWLLRHHIRTQRTAGKLDVRGNGPFPVIQMIGKNAAELRLPAENSILHPVFHVSLLMPYFGKSDNTAVQAAE